MKHRAAEPVGSLQGASRIRRNTSARAAKPPTPSEVAFDARVRRVVLDAKRAGSLGAGSPWVATDPMDDDAWGRAGHVR